jgi:hypothetical protein
MMTMMDIQQVLPTNPFAEWKAITPELLQDGRDNKEEETK